MGKKTRISLILIAVLALIEGIGAVATELTNNVPMTAGTIKVDLAWPWTFGKSTVADVQKYLEKEKQAHAFFNFPDKGTISAGNSIVITNSDVIKDVSPLPAIPTAKHDIYLLEPVENLDVTNPVEYGMDLAGKGNSSPFPEQYQQEAIKNNVKNMLLLKNIPEDSVLLSPIDGVLRYLAFPDPNITDVGAEIVFTASDGTEEEISIAGFDILRLAPLIDSITPFTGNNPPGDIIYIQVKRGQPIAKTLQSGDLLVTSIAQPDKNNSSNIYPTNINLLSIPDPTTGTQKTVIVASQ
jgi:hypothetical protein